VISAVMKEVIEKVESMQSFSTSGRCSLFPTFVLPAPCILCLCQSGEISTQCDDPRRRRHDIAQKPSFAALSLLIEI
jgi:hypothetical protein